MKALVFTALVAFFWASNAHAQKSAAEQLVSMAVDPSTPLGQPQRLQLTNLLLTFCRDVLVALPTNTPAEENWINNEMKARDIDKIRRATNSPEYARYKLHDTFQTCVERASKLSAAQSKRTANNNIGRFEGASYVSLAVNFNSDEDILTYAKRAGLNVKRLLLEFLSEVRRSLLFASLRSLEDQ